MLHRPSNGPVPGPTYMSKQQMGAYLNDLRTTRIPRPSGSRPLPQSSTRSPVVVVSSDTDGAPQLTIQSPGNYSSASHSRSCSAQSLRSDDASQPYAYVESDRRWTERQEAHSLRLALQGMPVEDDDTITQLAWEEATELIRKHEQPDEPYTLEESSKELNEYLQNEMPRRYASLKGAMRRFSLPASRKSSSGSSSSNYSDDIGNDQAQHNPVQRQAGESRRTSGRKSSGDLFNSAPLSNLKNRRRSSGSVRKTSRGAPSGAFANPEDKIYEDPEERSDPPVISTRFTQSRRNPFSRRRTSGKAQAFGVKTFDLPNPQEAACSTAPNHAQLEQNLSTDDAASGLDENTDEARFIDGIEVRSNDIRAATSPKRKDRSPRLPTPAVVSDSPGRPIVSFNRGWTPRNTQEDQPWEPTRTVDNFSNHVTVPDIVIPEIHEPVETDRGDPAPVVLEPSYFDEDSSSPEVPQIMIEEAPEIKVAEVPTIAINSGGGKPMSKFVTGPRAPYRPASHMPPRQSEPSPTTPSTHYSPIVRRQTALCAQCALPISGRIVTAAGTRFHPECFNCYHCGEGLECVAFYPEPEDQRLGRLDRIQRRLDGEYFEEDAGCTAADDGDESPRFYCHLDFHEFFSPRCKSCKTPIEGEVVVACGAEWHVGHFFCAQCGDPFDSSMPFVEKDGYAWCVNCHTNRYSARCKKCRKPVTDMVVNALGAEWHDECFQCTECNGPFEDGKYFVRDDTQNPVCMRCEARRLKS